jgi:hypothetical protein
MLATTEIKMDAGVAAFWPGRELVVSSNGNTVSQMSFQAQLMP